jgi:hypothetical protein
MTSTYPVKYIMYLNFDASGVEAAMAKAIIRGRHSHTRVMAAMMLMA